MNNPVAIVSVETWMVKNNGRKAAKSDLHGDLRPVEKIATRVQKGKPLAGTFVGSTNYRGTFR